MFFYRGGGRIVPKLLRKKNFKDFIRFFEKQFNIDQYKLCFNNLQNREENLSPGKLFLGKIIHQRKLHVV